MIRDLKLFGVVDDDARDHILVEAIHNDSGYRQLRQLLASQYNIGDKEPNIQVVHVDVQGDRSLTLQHSQFARWPISSDTGDVLKHLHRLWKFPVKLGSIWNGGKVARYGVSSRQFTATDATSALNVSASDQG